MTTREALDQRERVRASAGKNAAALMAADIGSRAVGLLAFIVVARAVGPSGFGQLNLALGALAFLALVSDPGLQYVAQRSYVRSDSTRAIIVSRITGLRLALAVLSLGLAAGAFAIGGTPVLWLLLLYSVSLIPSAVSFAWLFTASERMGVRAIGQLVGSIVFASFVLAFVRDSNDLVKVPLGLVLGNAISALFLWRCATPEWRSGARRPSLRGGWSTFKESLPFGTSLLLAQSLVWAQTFLLAAFATADQVGVFHAAYRWILLAMGVGVFFPQALFPVMVRKKGSTEGERLVEEAMRVVGLAGVLVALFYCGASSYLVSGIFGTAYASAVPVLWIASWAVPLALHNSLAAHYLNAIGHEKTALRITAAVVASNITLNLVLIPPFGPRGAAGALLLSEALSFALCLAALRALGIRLLRTYGSMGLAVAAAVATLSLVPATIPFAALTAFGVLVVVLLATREINLARWRLLHAIFWAREPDPASGAMTR